MATDPSIPSDSAGLLERRERVVARGVPRASHSTVRSGAGAVLTDQDGRPIIDFAAGIGVANVGHCAPDVVAAIQRQATELLHACIHVSTYESYVALCERLVEILPHGDSTKVMLTNSGAEAMENAVKIARQATGRTAVLCFTGGFHGRTLLGMSLTSRVAYKTGCGPFAPEIYRLPFPDPYAEPYADARVDEASMQTFVAKQLAVMADAFHTVVAASDLAAIVIEPVLGEGGVIPVPEGYLKGLRALCDQHGIMLILDEVQTGFGRTGDWGAYQRFGVIPDLSTWAKGMGGGMPIAAVVGKASVMDAARPGTIGGTFGGNPVCCAAALAAIDVIDRQGLRARSIEIGEKIRTRFETLPSRCASVNSVRGMGAMWGLELLVDRRHDQPAVALAKGVLQGALARGVLALSAGVHGNVIRLLPPLVIQDSELDHGLDVIESEILSRSA